MTCVRAGGVVAVVTLSAAVLWSDGCAHRRYTMRVTETVPAPPARRSAAATIPGPRARGGPEQGPERRVQTSATDGLPSIVATSGDERPRPQGLKGSLPSDRAFGSPAEPDREPSTTGGPAGEGAVSQHNPRPGSVSAGEPVSIGLVVGAGLLALLLLIAALGRRQVRV